MRRSTKGLQYQRMKEECACIFYFFFLLSLLELFLCIFCFFLEEEISKDIIYGMILTFVGSVIGLLYSYSSKIKTKILTRYGVRHRGEIVKAKYGLSGYCVSDYYMEIEFTNSKGKRKTFHAPAYRGDPNSYLKNQYCSIYEWKGFYVEGDFRMREEKDNMAWYGPIPTEKKHFIWR